MRVRIGLFALAVAVFVMPSYAHAAIPFFGPIIPPTYATCAASFGLLVTVVNNIISFMITALIMFVAPLMIAYAGALMVLNPTKVGDIEKAKTMLWHTVVGIIIALAAWLIIDLMMAALYNPREIGRTWSQLVVSGGIPPCINLRGSLNQAGQTGIGSTTPALPHTGRARGICGAGNTACSTSAIQDAARALNMTLSDAEASAMSCIAMTESSGNPNTPQSPTGACGTFQITTRPGNWSNPAYHRGSCSISSSCNDAACNLQTALLMFSRSGYQPWTGLKSDGTPWNANARACVQRYDPGTSRRLQ